MSSNINPNLEPYKITGRFKFWCQKVLPLVYDDTLSYSELICKVVNYLNQVIENENDISEYLKEIDSDIETLKSDIVFIKTELEKVKNGDYVSLYLDSLINWIDKNLVELVGRIVKYVFFTIDDNGYFNALIPWKWDFLEFDTDYNPESENYLHLILYW